METKNLYSFGPFRVDSANRLLLRDGQPVSLTPKAFDTLLVLVGHGENLVHKDELIRRVWPDTVVEENNLSQSISALRKALGDTAPDHPYIVTVPGWGYRFAAQVSLVSGEKRNGGKQLPAPELPSPPEPTGQPIRFYRKTALLAFTALCFLGVALLYRPSSLRRSPTSSRPAVALAPIASRRAVAVLGFRNLSGGKEDAWLSTALSEMLSTELAAGGTLRLVSGEEVARVKSELAWQDAGSLANDTLLRIHQNLGSDLLVVGAYTTIGRKGNKQIRVDLRLQNAISGETVAEIAETGAEANLFDLVSRAGIRLREKLGISDLSPTEAVEARASLPSEPEAARLYSEGLARLRVFDGVHARDLLRRSVALEPNYAAAHSSLSDAWSSLGYDNKALEEAKRAFELSANLSREDRLTVEGRYRTATRDWNHAIEVYETLFALFPDALDYGLRLASTQTAAARGRDALVTVNGLRRLPLPAGNDARIGLEESKAWNSLGDYKHMELALADAAEKARKQGAQLLLARALNQECWALRFLAQQQEAMEDCREAQRIYAAAGDRGGEADTLRVLGDVVSDSDVRAAMPYYERSLAIQREIEHPAGQAIVLNELAIQYAIRGEHATARRLFEQALTIFRQLDNRVSATGMMINVAYEFGAEGEPEKAIKLYQETFDSAEKLGNRDIQGLASYDLGLMQQLEGNLQAAKLLFRQSLAMFQEVEDRTQAANATYSLGEIAMLEDDLAGAHKLHEQALMMRQASGQRVPVAESRLDLAALSLEEGGSPAEAEASARQAIEVFHRGRATNDEADAIALLARSLFAEGKSDQALKAIEQALAVSEKAEPNIRLSVAVTVARIRAASLHNGSLTPVLDALIGTLAKARKLGYFGIELEARLALGEIEVKSGVRTRGRAELQTVERDASQKGFVLLARKAASHLREAAEQAVMDQSGGFPFHQDVANCNCG
jgi:DNA-binding winged helix-turn-helix (wHTH) protein/tetratricopeptide (TPR) repeat protein